VRSPLALFGTSQGNPEMRQPDSILPDDGAQLLDAFCQFEFFGLGLKGFDLPLYLVQ